MRLINLTTNSGITTIRVEDISAYCVNEEAQGMLKKNIYVADVHMISGTIFTSRMSEAQLITFEDMMQDSFLHHEKRRRID
jgi:hypothetical protein